MTERYHHGDLRNALIHNGLKLFNESGVEGFSLRKVAKACGVSHTAPYKHFQSKEELIQAIGDYVLHAFADSLQDVADQYPDDPIMRILEIGKRYVMFLVEHPDYLRYLFVHNQGINVRLKQGQFESDGDPVFVIFQQSAAVYLNRLDIPIERHAENIMAMWSMVQGISFLLVSGTVVIDQDVESFVGSLLNSKLKFD